MDDLKHEYTQEIINIKHTHQRRLAASLDKEQQLLKVIAAKDKAIKRLGKAKISHS